MHVGPAVVTLQVPELHRKSSSYNTQSVLVQGTLTEKRRNRRGDIITDITEKGEIEETSMNENRKKYHQTKRIHSFLY